MGALLSCFRHSQYKQLDENKANDPDDNMDLGIPTDAEFMAAIQAKDDEDAIQLSDQEIAMYLENLKSQP
ncbi:hypothetical protein TVAG_237540 [Trichomonas vaginalis G3]|uniref:Uncharacterized protein n=1 Tax=Trichomonas vaginalis (strain ATCC PRA-98 / G3) TaxID=412133 RepID=A2DCV4_TRIV3|nr:hypothetical protein TVAGG3_0606740 [Trichomonas vaginalis G3]EAY21728.1 hypothetical protein TVAG_237540 [Trichomonas vaginalis G3]KAI5524299.1 hypothetical protein TVAGG3_0606740 [Trichomonas vaginalis G3]|eukprot:XP_001582714.1 hypothetical protein [Trichomonas vaginalis G3]